MKSQSVLFIRHLPSSLSKEEKDEFLRHFGAERVRIMGNKGPLKHTAFAEFPNKETANLVITKLHQAEMLGCRLIVEFARESQSQHLPSVSDSQPKRIKEETTEEEGPKGEKKEEPEGNTFDLSFLKWGLNYPRRRRLHYLYPPPSPSILTNISHALAACPRFYVQVLHLMNKMDLPAPFGPITQQPPMAEDQGTVVDYAAKLQAEQKGASSTEESEMESETDTHRTTDEAVRKRKSTDIQRQIKKRARLAMSMFQTAPPVAETSRAPAPTLPLQDVFEQAQAAEGGAQRRIQLRLPSGVTQFRSPMDLARDLDSPSHLRPTLGLGFDSSPPKTPPRFVEEDPVFLKEDGRQEEKEEEVGSSSGFGVIEPVPKVVEESQDGDEEDEWSETKFISRGELRKGRLSYREMEDHSIFRNYKEGEPSRRLYIKNLARQVTEEDLHWIFGRYLNWEVEAEKNIFDIRLMKEGRMKGQAFVTLAAEDQAIKAVRDTNAFVLKGKPMAVLYARSAKQQEEGKS